MSSPDSAARRTRRALLIRGLGFLLTALALNPSGSAAAPRPPNIIFVLADDLGYGDLGCYGQTKIRTPNLDRLAEEGLRFTHHYAGSPVCAPSRCVLLTGKHSGHAWIRDNSEVQPEGQKPLAAAEVTVPELLRRRGYVTGAFGKWGLGPPGSAGDPLLQGFDRFYGYHCQRHAHNHFPAYLWDSGRKVALANPAFSAHQKLPPTADPQEPAAYGPYVGKDYAPDLIFAAARRFIRENQDRQFFAYVPITVPHLALQAPAEAIAPYAGAFPETPYTGDKGYLPQQVPRSTYAAMITRMDHEVGTLIALVKELGLDTNTVIVFTSDNGPTYGGTGGSDSEFFRSAGLLRGLKGSLYEGGVRVPLIVRWPGRVKPGTSSSRVTGFEDWLPTLLELAGAKGNLPQDLDGISFLATLLAQSQPPRPFLYREFPAYGGQQAVWTGDWKGVRQGLKPARTNAEPNLAIELYNLRADPGEATNVAAQYPRVVAKIEAIMRAQHTPSKEFPLPALDRLRAGEQTR
jgi:arylsulfatase